MNLRKSLLHGADLRYRGSDEVCHVRSWYVLEIYCEGDCVLRTRDSSENADGWDEPVGGAVGVAGSGVCDDGAP